MKTTTMLLVILAVGLLVAGCSKTSPTNTAPTATQNTIATSAGPVGGAADAVVIDDNTTNPDVGTLDDTPVSDELPQ